MTLRTLLVLSSILSFHQLARAGDEPLGCIPGQVEHFGAKFSSLRTGYYPDGSEMEGGFRDRLGKPLQTLQRYLAGKAPYVSVAMDSAKFAYGTVLRIPAVELYFHRCIEFRVVDTGGRFEGAGTSKIDLCNDTEAHSLGAWTNGRADVYVIRKP